MMKKEGKETHELFGGGKICIDNLIGNNKGFKLKYIKVNYILGLPTFPIAILKNVFPFSFAVSMLY